MTINPRIKHRSLLNFVDFRPFFNQLPSLLRQTLLTSFLVRLIWLPGLPISPTLAAPDAAVMPVGTASQLVNPGTAESDRMKALITCLPKELSQPSLKRALSEMGNDQVERTLNLKADPKLSQAESDLAACLNREAS